LETCTPRPSAAAALVQLGCLFHDTANRLRDLAQRLDGRIDAWKQAGDERSLLGHLTDRELGDIGIDRHETHAVDGGLVLRHEILLDLERTLERMRGC
jgi:uncharacterized protein YjiS (DUF1127 family)